ncbi:caveolin-1-like [Patiria miniata]|uniref:Caveolin n=1 Tax=Patiria miniata TaxID=46514 RepID=A0A914B047_PATMI|nr:caveolin-1-like [Patiria miniata]
MNPDPWNVNSQQPPKYPPLLGSAHVPTYSSGAPPAATAGQPAGMGGERPASRADTSSFSADEEDNMYGMTHHVKVKYAEVFKEADGADSFEPLANVMGFVFTWTQLGFYRFFSLIFGVFLVFHWGIVFAFFNFFTVFIMQPTVKLTFILLRPLAMMHKALVRTLLDPLWQSNGLIFSRIMGRFAFNFKGLPGQKPTRAAAIEEL